MTYYLGIDLGTSSLKILLGNDQAEILVSTSQSFVIHSFDNKYSEENPNDWLQAFDEVFKAIIDQFPQIKKAPLVLSFSGQMHSLVVINQNGEPIRPAILWNDGRTTVEVDFLRNNYGNHLLETEKNRPLEGFTLPKLLWIKKMNQMFGKLSGNLCYLKIILSII